MEGHTSSHGNVIPSPVSLLTSYYHTTSCGTVWDNYNLLCLESGLYSIGTMCNSQCYTGARQIEGSNNRIRCFRESWKPHEEPRWDPTPLHCQGGLPVSYFIPSQKTCFIHVIIIHDMTRVIVWTLISYQHHMYELVVVIGWLQVQTFLCLGYWSCLHVDAIYEHVALTEQMLL